MIRIELPPANELQRERLNEQRELRRVAETFESLLLQQLVTRMRESHLESGLFGDQAGSSVYESMFDRHIAESLATNSPLGIATMLEREWDRRNEGLEQLEQVMGNLRRQEAQQVYGMLEQLPLRSASAAPAAPRTEPAARTKGGARRVSRGYGWGPDPIEGDRRFHAGIDVAAPLGTPVLALSGGRVVEAGRRGGYGLQVLIAHEDGLTTRYAHLSGANVRVGQRIGPGQPLGKVGSSGRSTGPHLHLETMRGGRHVDPAELVGGSPIPKVLGRTADD